MLLGDRERSGVYSGEAVLGRLQEKDKLYQEYRKKPWEAAGDYGGAQRYVNGNGRMIAADTPWKRWRDAGRNMRK